MYNICLLLQIDLGNIKQCLFQSLFFIHSQRLAHAVGLYVDLECRCHVYI